MAGHSKWANIKHRKSAQDAKRSKIFGKLSKEIMVATAKGGKDPIMNASLKLAIAKAKSFSMPKKNIENAIKKGSGESNGKNFKEITYGGNVSGVSFLIKCLTDNVNRLSSSIQYHFNRANGEVLGISSVNYIFERKGILEIEKSLIKINEDDLMLIALEINIDEFISNEETYLIYCHPKKLDILKEKIVKETNNDKFLVDEISYVAVTKAKLKKENAAKILNFIDKLEDDEDIQEVFHNLEDE